MSCISQPSTVFSSGTGIVEAIKEELLLVARMSPIQGLNEVVVMRDNA